MTDHAPLTEEELAAMGQQGVPGLWGRDADRLIADLRAARAEVERRTEENDHLRIANRALRDYAVIWARQRDTARAENRQLREQVDAMNRQVVRHPYRVDL